MDHSFLLIHLVLCEDISRILSLHIIYALHIQVGVAVFGFAKAANDAPNPMSMLSSMMQAGAGAGGMDMNNMMMMLQNMQGGAKR